MPWWGWLLVAVADLFVGAFIGAQIVARAYDKEPG